MTRPSAKMSLLAVTSRPSSCSGAMYAGVPARMSSTLPIAARPKSITRTLPAPSSMTLAGFEIAMDDAALMGGGESRAQLARDVGGFVFGESANPAQRAREVFPVDVLHREIQEAVGLADVVHAAHVGVGDLPRGAHLVVELSRGAPDRGGAFPAGASARPAGRGAGRPPDTPRPCPRGRAGR